MVQNVNGHNLVYYLIEHSYFFLEFSSVFHGLPFKFGDHFSNTCCLMEVLACIPCCSSLGSFKLAFDG